MQCIKWVLALFFCISIGYAQSGIPIPSLGSNRALEDLQEKLESANEEDIAYSYMAVARELNKEKDLVKAIMYYNKARDLYAKLKDKKKIATVEREIGKLYERLGNKELAMKSYESALVYANDSVTKAVNQNDIIRLGGSTPKEQTKALESNLKLLEGGEDKTAQVETRKQLAEAHLKEGNKEEAVKELLQAKEQTKQKEVITEIDKQISTIYIAEQQYDKAEQLSKELLEKAKRENNKKQEIEQLCELSTIAFAKKNKEEGLRLLNDAYELAMGTSQTLIAKDIVSELVKRYQEFQEREKGMALQANYLKRLDQLVLADSTLVSSKLFQVKEELITQLEKERGLNDQLINRTTTINYILIGFIVSVMIFLFFIYRTLFSIKKKNKQIALQSLRREMNPHFIFNSLNSVNQFIAQNNELEANKYLSSYSRLMRNVMENSNKDFVQLSTELEQLKEYLDLEHLRFSDKFDYQINVSEDIDEDFVLVPNMIIQPQLENAIWHGLRYKDTKGVLVLSVVKQDNKICIIVEDNGIGLTQSAALKTANQRDHKSRGVNNTVERIRLLNELYHTDITMDTQEKVLPETGVRVVISFTVKKE